MIISAVRAEIRERLMTIPKLNGFDYNVKKVPVPGFTIGPPELIEYDQTYGRGQDRMRLPLLVLVGLISAEASERELEAYMDGEGARSFKAILNPSGWTSCDDVFVTSCEPDTYESGGVTLLGAEFTLIVCGEGAPS
jgi:hypothetical protein